MHEMVKDVLGREYSVALENEINKLKQTERMLIGDIVAVVSRSDRFLGRPIEDCNTKNEADYVIFKPSKYSIICHKDISVIKNDSSNIKLVSLNYFVDQLLEFNFTFLQLILCDGIKYETKEFVKLRKSIIKIINENSENFYKKQLSLLCGVIGDLNKNKFKEDVLKDRVFLVYTVLELSRRFINNREIIPNHLPNDKEYNRIVSNYNQDIIKELNTKLSNLKDIESKMNFKDKHDYIVQKYMYKYEIMKDLVLEVLEV